MGFEDSSLAWAETGKTIFHLSFSICHLSLGVGDLLENDKSRLKMPNDKCQMTIGK